MLSIFAKYIEMNDGRFSVFNSLLMAPTFVTKEELSNILNEKVSGDEYEELRRRGIFVASPAQDFKAWGKISKLHERHEGEVCILYLIVSTECNLRCKYCFVDANGINHVSDMHMSYETAIVAIDKFNKVAISRGIHKPEVIFYGGEPLLNNKVVFDVLKHCRSNKMNLSFTLITNATLIDDQIVDRLLEHKIGLGISIDGPQSIQDANRVCSNGRGTYDIVKSAVEKLKASDIPLSLSITLSEDMMEHKKLLINWIKNADVKTINFNLLHFEPGTQECRWKTYYEEVSEFLILAFEEMKDYGFFEGRFDRKVYSFVTQSFRFCDCAAASASQITVKPNGNVCICHAFAKNDEDDIGNILTDSIESMLTHDRVNKWKKMSTIYKEECFTCEAIAICGGGCPLQAKALFGDLTKVDKPFCIHTKKSFKWLMEKLYTAETGIVLGQY